jgi:hypothetical protein
MPQDRTKERRCGRIGLGPTVSRKGIGIRTYFGGSRLIEGGLYSGRPAAPKYWNGTFPLSMVSRVAPASEVVNNKNPPAQTRIRLFSDSSLHKVWDQFGPDERNRTYKRKCNHQDRGFILVIRCCFNKTSAPASTSTTAAACHPTACPSTAA